jgi:hypothetical protein
MVTLSQRAGIFCVLRTGVIPNPAQTIQTIFERLRDEKAFDSINKYIYSTLHHHHPEYENFNWKETPLELVSDIKNEPRVSITLRGSYSSISLDINCRDLIQDEIVDGKKRKVPEPSDFSTVYIKLRALHFLDLNFTLNYLKIISDIFVLFSGYYGFAQHVAVKHGNDYDRVHSDLLDPWFVTWSNLFGPDLVDRFGSENLMGTPVYEVRELSNKSIMMIVSKNPLEQLDPEVQKIIDIAKRLLNILSPSERVSTEELSSFNQLYTAREERIKQRIADSFQKNKTAAEMLRQADGCIHGVEKFFNERINYDKDSLVLVDRLIDVGYSDFEDEETLQTSIQAFGAFLGELIRRELNGEWEETDKERPSVINIGKDRIEINPFKIVERRFIKGNKSKGFSLAEWFSSIS